MNLIQGLLDGGAMQSLQRTAEFAEARQRVLAHSVANASTPYFKPRDLNPRSFQQTLGDAVDRRRQQPNVTRGELMLRDTRQLKFGADGLSAWEPEASNESILRHDENNSSLERLMQHLAENTMAHDLATQLIKNQFQMLESAIRGRL